MIKSKPCVLTIAGSDSSGGAGIQADIKTISATGSYAASVITALTAQNTRGVQAIQAISPEFVMQQLESVFNDLNIQAVKIGMLHNQEIIATVSTALKKFKPTTVILDPVMLSKNNCELLNPSAIDSLKIHLFPHASLITPNLMEAEKLLDIKINNSNEQEAAAINLAKKFQKNILIKGGHSAEIRSSDIFYHYDEGSTHWFHAERIFTNNSHGTGCSLSSAIASYLAQGYLLKDAINMAKKYLTKALEVSTQLQIGHGYGPVDHFYFLKN